jgi:DNA-binding MarR family transcriptional regulator
MMREHRLPELSVPQFRTLALLNFNAKTCLSTVADYIGSSLPAASRMVDGLVAKNLVARTPCPDDRRQISLQLTPLGRKYFLESRQATRVQLATQLAGLTPEQKQGIVAAMDSLAEIFGTDAECPSRVDTESGSGNAKPQD